MIEVTRLLRDIRRSQEVLEPYRVNRREFVKQYVGHNWSQGGSLAPVPLNLLALYVPTVLRSVAPKAPQIMLSTDIPNNMPKLAAIERWGNQEIERMQLERTFKRFACNALFSLSTMKVGLATPADAARFSWKLKAGKAFCECVSLDDLVFDPAASHLDEVSFIGHRFRVPLDVVKDSKLYNKNRLKLEPTKKRTFNSTGDERTAVIGDTRTLDDDGFEDITELWEIYLPRHNLIMTIADKYGDDADENRVIREQAWVGPDSGPYYHLGFGWVPDNPMPKAPIQDLIDMHLFTNEMARKVMSQNRRAKKNTLIRSEADGQKIKEASDGDMIPVTDPSMIVELESGGVSEKVQMAAIWGWQTGKELGGNLDALAGLAPGAKTATQDKMLTETASAALADMQAEAINAYANVLKACCWYWFHDPDLIMTSQLPIPDTVQMKSITPRQRMEMTWDEIDIRVDPYSMQYMTPQQRAAQLDQTMMQVVMPLAQLMAQQGKHVDIETYLKYRSKYLSMPEMNEIIEMGEPMQGMTPGAMDMGMKPAQTERRYVRENVSERTNRGDAQNMMNQLMGVQPGGDPRVA